MAASESDPSMTVMNDRECAMFAQELGPESTLAPFFRAGTVRFRLLSTGLPREWCRLTRIENMNGGCGIEASIGGEGLVCKGLLKSA